MKFRPLPGPLAAAITLTLLLLVQPASADERDGARDGGATVLANREVREKTGKTIAQWGARWWQWAFKNPEVLGDTTGEFGYLGDVGGACVDVVACFDLYVTYALDGCAYLGGAALAAIVLGIPGDVFALG